MNGTKLKLNCPLCCNEVFDSRDGLKYHLLSVADNLICPSCSERFEKIVDLVDHLDNCHDKNKTHTGDISQENATFQLASESDDKEMNSILAQALLKTPETQIEAEINASTVTKDEDKNPNNTQESGDMVHIVEENNEEEIYYCSCCDISFMSIAEHLQNYHEGQEVYIQTNDEAETTNVEENTFVVVQDKMLETMEVEDDLDVHESGEECTTNLDENSEVFNTLKQEDVMDKNGRMYTRKVVQVGKFWDKQDKNEVSEESLLISTGEETRDPPVTRTYLVKDGKAIKLKGASTNVEEKRVLQIHQCQLCQMHFCKLEQYYRHKCNLSTKNPSDYNCPKCDSSFFNHRALSSHMRVHRTDISYIDNSNTYTCEVCSTEFPTYKSLRLHMRMHEPVKVKDIEPPVTYGIMGDKVTIKTEDDVNEMFQCPICNKEYHKQYEDVHMKSHSDEPKYDCQICNRKFYTEQNLEMHVKVHSNGKKYKCSYCKKGFLSFESLKDHVKNICQSRPYECQYCGRRFMRPHEKVKHERIHTGEKPHVCGICGKAFRVSYCLTLHMRTHSGTRPYKCNHCGKRFKAHSVYNHHLLTHSTIRNYKCPYCPKAFKTGVQLAGHKNSHLKPFTCTECNRPFASLYAVRAHMDTHKRENNLKYSCWMCGASYARAFALRDHVKEQHTEVEWDKNKELTETEFELVPEEEEVTDGILPVVVLNQVDLENVKMDGIAN